MKTVPLRSRHTTRQANRWGLLGLLLLFVLSSAYSVRAQTGYIYVHKKTLNEESSPDFTFNVTGGPTTVPTITLNDQPTTLRTIASLGGDAAGGLWAQAGNSPNDSDGNYATYYRAPNSSTWTLTPGAGVVIDGGAAGTHVSVASGGVYYYDGTTETDVTGNLGAAATDVADNWLGVQYAVLNNNQIWRRTTASTTWTQIPGISGVNVDAIPNTNQIVYVSPNGLYVYRANNDGTGEVSLDRPAQSTRLLREMAVSGDGTIYVLDNLYVYRYTGSGWVTENQSLNLRHITGGPTSQLWGNIASTGTNIPNRIHSRTETADYLEDENVRTTPNDNSVLLAVAPGTYTINEGAVANWNLTDITIYETQSATSTSSIPGRSASVVVSAGEVVHVVFENQLTQTTAVVNVCGTANTFIETFGTGTGYGSPLTGLTSYHKATNTDYGYGYYALINNTNQMGGYAGSYTDHTGDANGRMLGVDATVERGIFYRRRFTNLLPGIQYDFSAWAMNVNAASVDLPNISFEIYDPVSGNLLNSSSTGNITTAGVWQKSSLVFTATQSTIELVLRNNTVGTLGNDLAIDDITFGLAGPPQPIAATGSATCTGLGSLTISAPTGPTIEYSVDGTTYQAGTIFSSLAPGVYSVTARYTGTFACTSTPTSVTINSAVCGNVLNDVNGLTDNTVNGPGVNGPSLSGTPLYASLVSNGVVIATVPVTSTGTYSFSNVANGAYSVVLTTNAAGSTTPSLPASWTSTGENVGTAAGNDGTPNGILPVTVSGASVTNANLGIEQVPTAGSGVNTVLNPGGTTPVPVPTNTFTNTTPSSDVAPGTVTSILITGFPTNTTSLTINGTVYTPATFPAGGVVVPTDGSGNPTVPISVDPTNDANPVSIPFKAIDNAGVPSPNTGTAVLNFTAPTFNLSGNVLDDANGLTDNTVNGPGVNGPSLSGTPLYASLVSNGVVIATVPVTSTGTYSFSNVANGAYSVVLTTNAAGSTTPSLPASWTSTGENLGTTAGNDGSVNSVLPVTISGTSVTNANFGIEQVPTVTAGTNAPQVNPGGTIAAPVSSTLFTGTDPEDGTYPANLTGRTVTLTPATNGTLYYNGNPITTTTVIPNFDPTKVTLDPTATGATTGTGGASPDPTFTYTVKDNAGVESLPKTITVPFTAALPVSLVSFTAKAQADQSVLLEWSTSWERSNNGYTLERSKDLITFDWVGQVRDVAGTSNSLNTYRLVDATPYSGTSYYRLSQVDLDGTRKVFPAISVVLRSDAYGIFPNPVKDGQFTLNLDEPLTAIVNLYSTDGRSVDLQKGATTAGSLHLKASQPLTAGVYLLRVEERGQLRQYRIVIN